LIFGLSQDAEGRARPAENGPRAGTAHHREDADGRRD